MNRRQVLAFLGSAAAGGCLGGAGSGDRTTTRTTARTTESPATTPTDTTAATRETATTTETATPEPPKLGESAPAGCPDYGEHVGRVVCSPGTDAPLSMTPSSDSVSLPTGSLSFALANDTDVTFEVNFYAWRLHKRVDDEWYYVAPEMWAEPLHQLPAGESHEWDVSVSSASPTCESHCSSSDEYVTVRGLGGGTYAFGVAGWFAGQDYANGTGVAAQITLEGDPISLSHSDPVESVDRDGDAVVARLPEHDSTETVVVARDDSPSGEPERIITEQAVRHPGLRNALASFEADVETVRVENAPTRRGGVVPVGEQGYVEYEGQTYRMEVEDETTNNG